MNKKSNKIINDLVIEAANDGIIAVDQNGSIVLFNKAASSMTGISQKEAIDARITEVLPETGLMKVIASKKRQVNQEMRFSNGISILTTRMPLYYQEQCIGAFSIFKDTTDIEKMAAKITDLQRVKKMLESIIQSSDEAISVVDEKGNGLVINPAYSRLTGLEEKDVIGKPAHTDIAEGSSMHMKVLETRKSFRRIPMRVGPSHKEVLVNVSPIIVGGMLKGSVGVLQDVSELKELTKELERARQRLRTLEAKYTFEDIVGRSEAIHVSVEQARLSADLPVTILLRGNSGTGKELFAHAIHNASARKYDKFVRVNCAAIPEALIESELFGYEKGAFSGADPRGKKGLFEEAGDGTIFLDEIGELSFSAQSKLLRVLQEKEVVRVGGVKNIAVEARIIAATNQPLEQAVKEGTFREDLYYRLHRMPISIPSLIERKEDIAELSSFFLDRINQEYGRSVKTIAPSAVSYLTEYNWPGNVRELENILGRAVITMGAQEKVMEQHHLPVLNNEKADSLPFSQVVSNKQNESLEQLINQTEAAAIRQTLNTCSGNKTKTAQQLKISLRTLYNKIEKYRVE